jgi:hypothetical protein
MARQPAGQGRDARTFLAFSEGKRTNAELQKFLSPDSSTEI